MTGLPLEGAGFGMPFSLYCSAVCNVRCHRAAVGGAGNLWGDGVLGRSAIASNCAADGARLRSKARGRPGGQRRPCAGMHRTRDRAGGSVLYWASHANDAVRHWSDGFHRVWHSRTHPVSGRGYGMLHPCATRCLGQSNAGATGGINLGDHQPSFRKPNGRIVPEAPSSFEH